MPKNTPQLTHGHRSFIKYYTGRDPLLAWNATRSYMAAYPVSSERSASVGGSRLLNNPLIKTIIAKASARLDEKQIVDATFVLDQSKRLYDRAMGDTPIPGETTVTVDPETGQETVATSERYEYDPATARQALQLIGQHKRVQAFTVNVEHSHTHVLEQRLAARSKVIEGQASQVLADPILAGPGADDPQLLALAQVPGVAGDDRQAGAPIDAPQARTVQKVPSGGGQTDRDPADRGTARVSAGATAT